MAEQEQKDSKDQKDFVIEKIKVRPVNKKKLVRRTFLTAAMAAIFGLIACFTFLILEPVFSNWLYPEEEAKIIIFPEEQEEMSPEDMLSDNMSAEEEEDSQESMVLEEEQIQEILSGVTLDMDNYVQLYSELTNYVEDLKRGMVTITGLTSGVDWFNNVLENKLISSGIIIADTGAELLILADYGPIRKAESLTVTFYNDLQVDTRVKQYDSTTNLAILTVSFTALSEEMLDGGVKYLHFGSFSSKNIVTTPVVVLGNPMNTDDSVGYGIISSAHAQVSYMDVNYRILVTDIYGSKNAAGFLFNMKGQVIGVITNAYAKDDMENIITAYSITDLKRLIENMSNGKPIPYAGIKGVDVTDEAYEDSAVPYGAYVREVEMDSPAMQAGIQPGDVIVDMDGKTITKFSEYTSTLMKADVGSKVNFSVMRLGLEEYREMTFEITLEAAK